MLRIALFGCGRIGRVHADSIAAHPRAELAWVDGRAALALAEATNESLRAGRSVTVGVSV
jgi:predicted dehydrogenase